jgi:hypothetical protein
MVGLIAGSMGDRFCGRFRFDVPFDDMLDRRSDGLAEVTPNIRLSQGGLNAVRQDEKLIHR